MQVLHLVGAQPSARSDVVTTAEIVLASMLSQDPSLVVEELVVSGATRPPAAADQLFAADRFVLSVPDPGHLPDGLSALMDVLQEPAARLARAEDRRRGHRVARRMVVIAPCGTEVAAAAARQLVARVQSTFGQLDLVEVGLICSASPPGPGHGSPLGPGRASARTWSATRASGQWPMAS
jgi:hypothetical protein